MTEVISGRYLASQASGMSAQMHPESVTAYRYPNGPQRKTAGAPTEHR
ncbi:hypothetical protein AB0H57_08630 [Micromonospora sp. NPDC050686]